MLEHWTDCKKWIFNIKVLKYSISLYRYPLVCNGYIVKYVYVWNGGK